MNHRGYTEKQILDLGRIPAEPFRSIVIHLLKREGWNVNEERKRGRTLPDTPIYTLEIFGERVSKLQGSPVTGGAIRHMLFPTERPDRAGPQEWFEFPRCDAVMTALGGLSAWLDSYPINGQWVSLADHYWAVKLRTPVEMMDDLAAGLSVEDCANGHVRTVENTGLYKRGDVYCKTCARKSTRKSRERIAA